MKLISIFIAGIIVSVPVSVSADTQRFSQDFSIENPIPDKAAPLLKAYLASIEALRPFMVKTSNTEPVTLKTHVCHNGDDPLIPCEQETVKDVRDLDVDAIPVKIVDITIDPKATPTPKP